MYYNTKRHEQKKSHFNWNLKTVKLVNKANECLEYMMLNIVTYFLLYVK